MTVLLNPDALGIGLIPPSTDAASTGAGPAAPPSRPTGAPLSPPPEVEKSPHGWGPPLQYARAFKSDDFQHAPSGPRRAGSSQTHPAASASHAHAAQVQERAVASLREADSCFPAFLA